MTPKFLAACFAGTMSLLCAGTAAAQEKLIMAWPAPAGTPYADFGEAWAAKVEADSNGAVDIDLRLGATIANFANMIERVNTDVVQIGNTIQSLHRNRFELSQVTSLPFVVSLDDVDEASAALWRLYETGLLDSDYADVVPLFFGLAKQSGFHFAEAPPSLDELDGLKIRIHSDYHVDMVEGLRMTPLSLPPQDQYPGLQRGTMDAVVTSWSTFPTYKLEEVTEYHLDLPLGGTVLMAFMGRDRYEGLPEEVRAAIDMNAGEGGSRSYGTFLWEDAERGRASAIALDDTIVELSPEKLEEWRERFGEPWIDTWLSRSPDGEKVLEEFRKIYAEVKAGN
jgi:TRAP-type C4-dicarboxylate transport system substrate-binding protein